MPHRLSLSALAAASVLTAGSASAAVIADFGNDPGKFNDGNTNVGFAGANTNGFAVADAIRIIDGDGHNGTAAVFNLGGGNLNFDSSAVADPATDKLYLKIRTNPNTAADPDVPFDPARIVANLWDGNIGDNQSRYFFDFARMDVSDSSVAIFEANEVLGAPNGGSFNAATTYDWVTLRTGFRDNATAFPSSPWNYDVLELGFTPIPEPASAALAGLGAMVMLRRRSGRSFRESPEPRIGLGRYAVLPCR